MTEGFSAHRQPAFFPDPDSKRPEGFPFGPHFSPLGFLCGPWRGVRPVALVLPLLLFLVAGSVLRLSQVWKAPEPRPP